MGDEISRYEAVQAEEKKTCPGTGCKRCRKQSGPRKKRM